MEPYRLWIAVGSLAGLLAVIAAAGAAHGDPEPGRVRAVSSAAQMLGWHALALVACGLWGAHGGALTHWAGAAFTLGLTLFCSAVYVPLWGGPRLGLTAPAGGMTVMLGWVLLGLSALRR